MRDSSYARTGTWNQSWKPRKNSIIRLYALNSASTEGEASGPLKVGSTDIAGLLRCRLVGKGDLEVDVVARVVIGVLRLAVDGLALVDPLLPGMGLVAHLVGQAAHGDDTERVGAKTHVWR
jgi:hypothetical protein